MHRKGPRQVRLGAPSFEDERVDTRRGQVPGQEQSRGTGTHDDDLPSLCTLSRRHLGTALNPGLRPRGSAKSGMWARRAAMAVSGPGPGPEPAQWLTACKVTALLPGQVSAAWRFAASDTPTLGAGLPCFYRSIRAAQALG